MITMFPRQLDEVARQRMQQPGPQAGLGRAAARGRGESRRIRRHTGWTLVAIGLRLAGSGG
jgi:hypothetical protein